MILLKLGQKGIDYFYQEIRTLSPLFYMLLNDTAMDKKWMH